MVRPKKDKELKPVQKASNILTEDQQAALFFQHKNAIIALKEKLASVNGSLRSAYKQAKAEGFTKKEIDFAIKLEDDEDDSIQKERQRQNQIARWLGVPLGTQTELDLEPDRRSVEEKAAAEGKKAGMNGETLNPPYDPGTPGYESFVEAWHQGQAAIFSVQKMKSDTELLRPESEDEGQSDDFDDAANGDFGSDDYEAGEEVAVMSEEDATAEEEIPEFLRRTEPQEEDA